MVITTAVVAPWMRTVVKVVLRRVVLGGGGGFVVRLDVGDEVVHADVQVLSREVEVHHRLDPVKFRRNCREKRNRERQRKGEKASSHDKLLSKQGRLQSISCSYYSRLKR